MLLFKLFIIFNISFMWFIHGGIFSGTLCNPFPTNINKDSAAVPEPLFIILTRLFTFIFIPFFFFCRFFIWFRLFWFDKFNPIITQSLI